MATAMSYGKVLTTTGQVDKVVKRAAQDYVKGSATLTANAAYATHYAVVTGYISQDKGKDGGMTQHDYAVMFGQVDSVVTLWKRLGRVLVVGGFTPEQDPTLWSRLSSQTLANKGEMPKIIMGEDFGPAKIDALRKAVDDHVAAADAARTKAEADARKRESRTAAEREADAKAKAKADAKAEQSLTKREAAVAALEIVAAPTTVAGKSILAAEKVKDDPTSQSILLAKALDRAVKGLDREGWAAVETILNATITRENTVRTAADAKAS